MQSVGFWFNEFDFSYSCVTSAPNKIKEHCYNSRKFPHAHFQLILVPTLGKTLLTSTLQISFECHRNGIIKYIHLCLTPFNNLFEINL